MPSSFNIFDVIVRLFPGCMLTLWVKRLFFSKLIFSHYESINFVLFLSVGFSCGALLYVGGTICGKYVIDRIAFGGNPRRVYLRDAKTARIPVIKDAETRAVARSIVKTHRDDAYYAFGWMINYLETHGFNEKEDRMLSLAGMSSSLAVTVIICSICNLFHPLVSREIMFIFSAICLAGFIYSYVHFTRIRYSVVVRTFEIISRQ